MNADSTTPKTGPSPLHLPRLLTSTLLLLVLIGLAVLLLSDLIASRKREYETVQRDSENLARVIDRQIMTAVEKIDVVLRETAIDYAPVVNDGKPRKLLDANLDLQRWMQYTPEVQKESLRVINKEGRVVYNAGNSAELPNVFVGDRAYFLQQKASKENQLVISEPLLSRFTNKWLLTLSRPMYNAKGEFGGVVQMALRTEYFQSMFEKLDIEPRSNVSLFDVNLRLLSRHPALPEQIGKQFDTPAKAGISAGLTTFHYENVSKVDGVNRLFVFRKLEGLPYLIVIGRSPEEFLYGWYVKAFLYGVAFICLSLALTSFLFVFYRHTERNRQLIAEVFEASDEAIVVTDAQGRVVTANHAFT
ncbi:MAG TPA: cache domain-containing protein, partial [Rhodocyclaceae bacterium]|nr:cache domain-containing protein [Rhodocyclaceae bacterium]